MPTSWNVSSLIRSARLVLGIRWLIGAIDASLPGALTLDFVGRLGADRREVAAAMMTASMAMRFMVKHGVVPFSGWVGVGGYDPERVERVGSMHSRIYGEPERASAMLDAPWWGGLRIRIAVCETDSWRVSLSGERRLDVDGVDTVLLEGGAVRRWCSCMGRHSRQRSPGNAAPRPRFPVKGSVSTRPPRATATDEIRASVPTVRSLLLCANRRRAFGHSRRARVSSEAVVSNAWPRRLL